jgi:hypothetical protein
MEGIDAPRLQVPSINLSNWYEACARPGKTDTTPEGGDSRMTNLLLSLATLLLTGTQTVMAATSLLGGSGGSTGRFSKQDEGTLNRGYHAMIQFTWHPDFARSLVLGLQARQIKLNYVERDVNKRATYNLYGAHFGLFHSLSKSLSLQLGVDSYPAAQLTVLSTHSVLLNSRRFKYSTWEQYTGDPALGLHYRLNFDTTDGQFSSRNRMRTGLGFSAVQQHLTQQSTEITTSSTTLSPEKTYSAAEVSYRMFLIQIDLTIGLTF